MEDEWGQWRHHLTVSSRREDVQTVLSDAVELLHSWLRSLLTFSFPGNPIRGSAPCWWEHWQHPSVSDWQTNLYLERWCLVHKKRKWCQITREQKEEPTWVGDQSLRCRTRFWGRIWLVQHSAWRSLCAGGLSTAQFTGLSTQEQVTRLHIHIIPGLYRWNTTELKWLKKSWCSQATVSSHLRVPSVWCCSGNAGRWQRSCVPRWSEWVCWSSSGRTGKSSLEWIPLPDQYHPEWSPQRWEDSPPGWTSEHWRNKTHLLR